MQFCNFLAETFYWLIHSPVCTLPSPPGEEHSHSSPSRPSQDQIVKFLGRNLRSLTCLGTSLHSSDWTSLGMSLHCWASTWILIDIIRSINTKLSPVWEHFYRPVSPLGWERQHTPPWAPGTPRRWDWEEEKNDVSHLSRNLVAFLLLHLLTFLLRNLHCLLQYYL